MMKAMTPEHEAQLFEAAPTFYQRDKLPFGFECGDGWFNLLLELGRAAEALNATRTAEEQLTAGQVKQKFGGLRCYVDGDSRALSDALRTAEESASLTCENCSWVGAKMSVRGYIAVLCPPCLMAERKRRG